MTTVQLVDQVDVAPLREAFERSGMTFHEVGLAAGWFKSQSQRWTIGDTSRVAKNLGLMDVIGRNGRRYRRTWVSYDVAVILVRAMGLYPVDFDL